MEWKWTVEDPNILGQIDRLIDGVWRKLPVMDGGQDAQRFLDLSALNKSKRSELPSRNGDELM